MDYRRKFNDVRGAIYLIAIGGVLLALLFKFMMHKFAH
jgi:hypothetical protein